MRWLLVISLCCLTACALEHQSPVPTETTIIFLPAPQEPTAQCVLLESPATLAAPMPVSLPPPKRGKAERIPPTVPPAKLIQQAEREALVFPTERGYHGASARQKYLWQPSKLFTVYLSPSAVTEIELPLGEVLASGLA